MKSGIRTAFLILLAIPSAALGMVSTNYSISSLNENYGSGSRLSANYQITTDIISRQPVDASMSTNYTLNGWAVAPPDADQPLCAVYINSDDEITNTTSVTLGLVCSDPSGCDEVALSNNGVGWSDPEPYSTFKPWELVANDGERTVFAKFKNGNGNWSGVCHDSIILDTTAPLTSMSPVGGTFMSPQSVAMTPSEPATIYYTDDGTVPTTGSNVYSGPVYVSDNNVTLQAFAVDEAGNTGSVVREDYEICNGSSLSISGTVIDATLNKAMPLVVITLDSGHSTSTNVNGEYAFTGLPRGYYKIESVTTASPGYVTYQKELTLCQTSIALDIVLTKDSTVFGVNTNSGYSANGVNTSTGNFTYPMSDIAIPGRGMSFVFDRTYNSQDDTSGPLGYGWSHNYDVTLSEEAGGEVVVHWGDGKTEVWTPDGLGGYFPMYGVYSTLTKNPDTTFTLRLKDMIEYNFDLSNNLASIVDEYGNTISFTYNGTELTTITDTVGRTINFTYDASSRITSILGPIGRSVTFSYDVNGDLVTSTNLDGKTTTYTYDDNHQMLTLTDPKGIVAVNNVYDDQRRVVVSQQDALGGEYLYTYDVANKKTKIIDPLGNASYHHFDDLLRLVQEDDPRGNSAYYTFDEAGNLENATDKNGNVTTYAYDANGNVLTKTEPLGKVTSATYDSNNNPLTKTDANGNTTTFTYDANGSLETVTDPLDNVTTYTYDTYGQLETVTDALNNVTTYEYDVFGNRVAVIDALSNRSTFTYDGVGRKLTENHPLGRATAYDYDNMDRLISVTDALGGESTFTFDVNGNKVEHLDARGNKTLFDYDAKNRLTSKTTPLNETESYVYDALDRRISVTNAKGAVSMVVYDAVGNVIRTIDDHGNTVRHEYDANGNKIRTTDALGNVTTYAYDELNRLTSSTDALGNSTSYTYDLNGNRLSVTDPLGNTTSYTYDEMNRLITVKDHLNNTTTNEYDELGRLVRVTDAELRQTDFEYDELGRLVRVTDAETGEVTAQYDAIGDRTSVTNTRGKTTNYTYDVLNRLTSETDPLGNAVIMVYDEVGNLISLSDSGGTTTYTYDKNNRLEQKTYPDSTTVTYSYDAVGNRLSVSDIMGTTSYTYNSLDQVSSVTDPFGMTVGYTYNPVGSRTAIKYPGYKNVFYTYDELNRLSAVQDWGGVTTTYEYDDEGRLATQTMGNGSIVSYAYDEAGRLTSKEDRDIGDNIIVSYTYTLDKVGNRTGLSMNQPLVPRPESSNITFTHNNGNQVITSNGTTFTYDGNGNRTEKDDESVATQYAYNYDDMLVSVTNDAETQEYKYNSDGQRLSTVDSGVETRYLLDQIGTMEYILAEMDSNNDVRKYYIYGDGLLYSIDGTTGERLFYHYDPIGSTVAITDINGNITDKYAYLPFGKLNRSETVHKNRFTYVGKFGVMQEDNGLHFMRARFYDPETRGFLSLDPFRGNIRNSQSLNLYSYVGNNPINSLDPDGEIVITTGVALFIAFVAIPAATFVSIKVAGWITHKSGGIDDDTYDMFKDAVNRSEKIVGGVNTIRKGIIDPSSPADFRGAIKDIEEGMDIWHEKEVVQTTYCTFSHESKSTEAIMTPNPDESKSTEAIMTPIPDESKPTEDIKTPIPRNPKTFLDVVGYASGFYRREFSKLLDPDFADKETRSYIELSIQKEIYELQKTRYGYRTNTQQDRMQKLLERNVRWSAAGLYSRLTATLSKYEVLIRDLSELPKFTSSVRRTGVYAGR